MRCESGSVGAGANQLCNFKSKLNPFTHAEKPPNIPQKTCSVQNARFFRYVWPFFDIMNERVKACIKTLLVRSAWKTITVVT